MFKLNFFIKIFIENLSILKLRILPTRTYTVRTGIRTGTKYEQIQDTLSIENLYNLEDRKEISNL